MPLSRLPAESSCVTLKLTLTALNMLGQPCQTDLWIPNSLESCSIFHWSWIFKKINPLKTYKTYHSGALCPKNKIASAISHYRQPHQHLLTVPHILFPSLADKAQLVTRLFPSTKVLLSLLQTASFRSSFSFLLFCSTS